SDGDPLYYYLYDGTTNPNSGHWVVNGTVVAATTTYTITAAQLAQTTFVTGTVGAENLTPDSHALFNIKSRHLTINNTTHSSALPVLSSYVSARPRHTILFPTRRSSDLSDGDPLYYYLYDGTTNPNSGHWVVNGTVVAATTTYTITAAQLAQTTFVTGTV